MAPKTDVIEQLRARIAELEEENARLNSSPTIEACRQMIRDKAVIEASTLHKQLAAEQLNSKRLRDALQAYIDEHEECQDADDWMAMMCSMEAHHTADEALSQPSDTSALDTFVAEKVKEATATQKEYYEGVFQDGSKQIAKAFRQRDLAVEALEKQGHSAGCRKNAFGDICTCGLYDLLSTIKESEAK